MSVRKLVIVVATIIMLLGTNRRLGRAEAWRQARRDASSTRPAICRSLMPKHW